MDFGVTDAISIFVSWASPIAYAEGVELVAVAVAVSFRDVGTSAFVDLTWTVADATCVVRSDTIVDVVTDAIGISVRRAVPTTHAEGVELVSVAVTVALGDVRTSALVHGAWSATNATCIQFCT